jgi:sigma-B regulation protein RsbU (phosphoserine phosphatase)
MRTIAALQHRLMPSRVPPLKGWDVAISYQVNGLLGGDYYDFFPLADSRRLALIVADASGHGGAAAVMVAQIRVLTFLPLDVRPRHIAVLPGGRVYHSAFGCGFGPAQSPPRGELPE